MEEKNTLSLSMPEKFTGFECSTQIENVLFHTVLKADAFLPNPALHTLPHNHAVFEGHLVLSKTACLVTPSGTLNLEKNDFFFIPPRMYHHAPRREEDDCSIAFGLSFQKTPATGNFDLFTPLSETLSDLAAPLVFRRAFALSHALFELTEEMGRGSAGKRERLEMRTAQILFLLLDLVCPQLRGEFHDALSPATRQQLTIDAFFAQNYNKDVTVQHLADIIYLSERQTNRVLDDLYGLSFKQKLIETRIQTAMQFLQATNRPIREIAEQSGYRSAVGFHSAFRQLVGMTPAKYRSSMRKKETVK